MTHAVIQEVRLDDQKVKIILAYILNMKLPWDAETLSKKK